MNSMGQSKRLANEATGVEQRLIDRQREALSTRAFVQRPFCRAVEEQQQDGVKRTGENERVVDKTARNEERKKRGFEYREQGKLT